MYPNKNIFKKESNHQEHHQQQMLARMRERKELSYTAGGNIS
jgi:hypothetical protein